jgi:hypothetical protein
MSTIDSSAALAAAKEAAVEAALQAVRFRELQMPTQQLPAAHGGCGCGQQHHQQPIVIQAPAAPQRRITGTAVVTATAVVVGAGALLAEVTALLLAVGIAALSLALVAVVLRGLVGDLRGGKR